MGVQWDAPFPTGRYTKHSCLGEWLSLIEAEDGEEDDEGDEANDDDEVADSLEALF